MTTDVRMNVIISRDLKVSILNTATALQPSSFGTRLMASVVIVGVVIAIVVHNI